jgi:hypothetical protein
MINTYRAHVISSILANRFRSFEFAGYKAMVMEGLLKVGGETLVVAPKGVDWLGAYKTRVHHSQEDGRRS